MKMQLTHDEQMVCMLAAIKLTAESTKGTDNPQRYQKDLGTFEYLVESAEAIGSEWVVAKYFNLLTLDLSTHLICLTHLL